MTGITRRFAVAFMLAVAGGSLVLSGTNTSHADDTTFTVVTDLDTFKAHFVGPKIMDPADSANFFIIKDDGTIEGTWHGAAMAGEWRWEDKYFCRSLSAPKAPEDCQEWGYAEGKARLVRDRGAGKATVYALGE